MKPRVYCRGKKKKRKEEQNGLTKPKGYYKGIGASCIGKIVASQSNHTQKKRKKKKKEKKKGPMINAK